MSVYLYPGVPALPFGVGLAPPVAPPLLTIDTPGIFPQAPAQWGLFDEGGDPVLVASSVAAIEYNRDWTISDYAQEQGAFFSYNKVITPFRGIVTFWVGGSVFDRAQFLAAAEPAVASLDLVTLVTPEISYVNANIMHYSYRREARQGVTLLRVDVWVEEVIPIGVASFSATQSVNGAATQNNGTVQPQTPSPTLVPGGALMAPSTADAG